MVCRGGSDKRSFRERSDRIVLSAIPSAAGANCAWEPCQQLGSVESFTCRIASIVERRGLLHSSTARFVLCIVLSLVVAVLLAAPASALSSKGDVSDRYQIVLNGHLIVAEGETVDTAVLVHGSATIAGTVAGSVVVFDGPTDISGHVQGDVFVFSGNVTVRSGAHIDGDLVTSQSPTVEPDAIVSGKQERSDPRFNAGELGFASRVAWWIGYSVSTLVLGLLLLSFGPALDGAIVRATRERLGASIGFGAAVFFLSPVVAALFLVAVITIPLGLFLLLALALLYSVGYVTGTHAIGRLLVKTPTSRFLAFLAGWAILRVSALIPIVGGLVWTLASMFGLGLLLVASRRLSPPSRCRCRRSAFADRASLIRSKRWPDLALGGGGDRSARVCGWACPSGGQGKGLPRTNRSATAEAQRRQSGNDHDRDRHQHVPAKT